MASIAIDWDAASVQDGMLSVPLSDSPGRKWVRRFRGALVMLDRPQGDWQAISVRHGTVTVTHVREGAEERLRHLLDSAIVEANGEPGSDAGQDGEPADSPRARDRRMTDAFQRAAPR